MPQAATLLPQWRGEAVTPLHPDTAFNGFICAHVVHALQGLGLLDELDGGAVDLAGFSAAHRLDADVVRALAAAAARFGYLEVRDDHAVAMPLIADARRVLGFFTWGVGGYHDVFAHAAALARGERRFGVDLHRDEGMVALGSAQADRALMRHLLDEQIAQLDFGLLVDLGAGVSERVSRLVRGRARSRGIGIDISEPATELGRQTVARYQLSDRVEPVCADVLDILFAGHRVGAAEQADVVMSFMFLHDLLADPVRRDQVVPRLRDAFPKAHTFLLADTTVSPAGGDDDRLPIFSSGFELAHALMGVPIYTREQYERLFDAGGMRLRRTVAFGAPHTYLFVLEPA
ncbi:SAM-dependent methyltransferase [Mangrovihabitans endophyticus]|uniref:SAM-dependent methyltransferase n=1 Tax=Mangrovihabitans endophyticus TaxID=1751298 RepID=A0A8J3BWY2_9ACTN|nr:class I SAM-dependent methyltransferase [Mangrovihabitans endophyticus]GGK74119.1 hypothetical protein GCM10012284_05160 [Mangrovihabitans endophyticus]